MCMPAKTFWITNISNRNVTLADLNISVPRRSSINLLDARHYHFTEEQLEKSAKSGSIFKKSDKIKKRVVPPPIDDKKIIMVDNKAILPPRSTSIYEIKQEHHQELDVFDNELIAEEPDKSTSTNIKGK